MAARVVTRILPLIVAVWLPPTAILASSGVETVPDAMRLAAVESLAGDAGREWAEEAKLVAADGDAGDLFGWSVAVEGDTALVGARSADVDGNENQGAAYVFVRSGGVWTEQARLTASDGSAGAVFGNFGRVVALSGDTALVTAGNTEVNGNANQGAAYVYVRSDGVWTEQAKLIASDGAAEDRFGFGASLSGDTVVVGALEANVGGHANHGAAYVFTRSDGVWTEQVKLTAADGSANDFFGHSAAISGETILIGARGSVAGGALSQGALYVFTRDGEAWNEQAKLTASDGTAGDQLGWSVALDGDTALGGALAANVGGNTDQGAAYLFVRSGGTWSEHAKLTASDGAAFEYFGYAVALSEGTALVGAPAAHRDGEEHGAAYAFGSTVGWAELAKLISFDGATGDGFGISVAAADDSLLVGAYEADVNGSDNQGAAYLFPLDLPPDFGILQGTVSSLGHCQADLQPLEGATVEIAGAQSTTIAHSNEHGFYRALLSDSESPLTITVTAPGHLPDTTTGIVFGGGDVVVEEFDLVVDAPCADVDPSSFSVELLPDATTAETLTIGNLGVGDLEWTLEAVAAESTRSRSHDPALDEAIDLPEFTLVSPIHGGEPVEFTVPAGVLSRGDVVGFSFVGTVSGVSSQNWASDTCMIVQAPDGAAYAVGGLDGELPGCGENEWDFPGFTDGTYESAHDDVFAPAVDDQGDWTFTFLNDAFIFLAEELTWTDVTVTLHKTPRPGCVEGSIEVDWLSIDPESGSTPSGETDTVAVQIDSAGLEHGPHEAFLCLLSNDSERPQLAVPVTLTVLDPTVGVLAGTVTSRGYCNADPGPIADALVIVSGQMNTFEIMTSGDGSFSAEISSNESPVDIMVAASGHVGSEETGVVIESGETTVLAFDLALDAPCASAEPTSLVFAVPSGGSETGILTIANVQGGAPLEWSIETSELPAGGPSRSGSAGRHAPITNRPYDGEGDVFPVDPKGTAGRVSPEGWPSRALGDLVDCKAEPGLIFHDDGSIESAYRGNPAAVDEVIFVDRFTPSAYPAALEAICLSFLSLQVATLDFEIVVFDDDGADGGPGTELGSLAVSAPNIPPPGSPLPPGLEPFWYAYDISSLGIRIDSGDVYLGARWTPPSYPDFFIAVDESPANPVGFAGGYWWTDAAGAWAPIESNNSFAGYRSLFVRAVENPGGCHSPSELSWLGVAPAFGETEAGGSTSVEVAVDSAGLAEGEYEAMLCVFSNDSSRPLLLVPVRLAVDSVGTAELAFQPAGFDFGSVGVGETSEPQTATLENGGTADATGLVFGAPGGGFDADTSACGDNLGVGESCLVSITFTPAEPGPAGSALEAASAEGASAVLDLAGHGMAPGTLFTATALQVDADALASDGNRVLEPGEQVVVAPEWRNDGDTAQGLQGSASSFTGPLGADYTIAVDTADYGFMELGANASCLETGACYQLSVDVPVERPATRWVATFDEMLSAGTARTWNLHIGDSFVDVPRASPFYRAIETLLHHEVTGGCAAGSVAGTATRSVVVGHRPTLPGSAAYCPAAVNTRGQMPVFVLRALEGADYTPPACEPSEAAFADVPATSGLCPWIQELFARNVVAGCGDGVYCPNDAVNRQQMAIFLLRTLEGEDYTPPACTGRFEDLPCSSAFAPWVEELANRGVTGGCSAEPALYCPTSPVNRQQMAVFVSEAFGLELYGP